MLYPYGAHSYGSNRKVVYGISRDNVSSDRRTRWAPRGLKVLVESEGRCREGCIGYAYTIYFNDVVLNVK